MLKKDFYSILPLILLAVTIAFSPSLILGRVEGGKAIEIRLEDILILILGLVWIANFLISGKAKIQKPPLFGPILAWLAIGFFSLLTNWLFMNVYLWRGFFFFLKEIEFFFIYFYVFYHIKNINSAKYILKLWIFLGFANALWIIFEILSQRKISYYYGPTLLMEPEGTLPGGGFLLVLFIFIFNYFLYYYLDKKDISFLKKGLLSLIVISPVAGIISSGSRAVFWGLIFSLILTFFLYYFKKKKIKNIWWIVFFLTLIAGIFLFVFFTNLPLKRLIDWKDFKEEFTNDTENFTAIKRFGVWKLQLREAFKAPGFLLFGYGKSVIMVFSESHNQYIRNLIEVGIIGSIIFFILIFAIIKKCLKRWQNFSLENAERGLCSAFLIATLTLLLIGFSAEVFIVVKTAEVYWFLAGLAMAVTNFNNQKELSQ